MSANTNSQKTIKAVKPIKTGKTIMTGKVSKKAMDKTLTVRVVKYWKHPVYKKALLRHKNYLVHNPDNGFEIGDTVKIIECRPISRRKRFTILDAK